MPLPPKVCPPNPTQEGFSDLTKSQAIPSSVRLANERKKFLDVLAALYPDALARLFESAYRLFEDAAAARRSQLSVEQLVTSVLAGQLIDAWS